MDINKQFQLALQHYQEGNLRHAENLCEGIIKVQPNNVYAVQLLGVIYSEYGNYDASIACFKKILKSDPTNSEIYYDLGTVFQDKGQLEEAIACYQKALQINPALVDAYYNLGTVLQHKRQLEEAIACYQKALQLKPDIADTHYCLANIFKEQRQFDEAIDCYRKAIRINPDYADAYNNLGNVFKEQRQFDKAIDCYRKAIQINPDYADAYNNLGNVFKEQRQFDKAIDCYRKAIQINPDYADAYNNLGVALRDKGQINEAIDCFRKAIQINPDYADAYNNLGVALRDKGQIDEAIDCCRKAIRINPDYADVYNNLGVALRDKGEIDEAVACYRNALQINPDHSAAYSNLGVTLQDRGYIEEAITYYKKAIEIDPANVNGNWNMSLALLLSGNLKEGFEKYEWRWKTEDFMDKKRDFSRPVWDGSSLNGKKLFIYSEQGVGDEIMFASCFNDVITKAELCIIECDKRLVPLFSRSFPQAKIIERIGIDKSNLSDLPLFDTVIAAGSLPLYFRTALLSFPQEKAYLIPDPEKIDTWVNRYKVLGEGLKVGISWTGGKKHYVKKVRSMILEQWAGLFSIKGIHFINLQYGDCHRELNEAKEKIGITIHDWEEADPLKDLDNFAAQIAALDLVISVDNATVHMAGALGKAVWTLLPYGPDWRWMLNREDSPWYPTMRLLRQPSPGDWESVLTRVKNELLKLLGNN